MSNFSGPVHPRPRWTAAWGICDSFKAWTVLAAFAKFAIILFMLPSVLDGKYPEVTLFAISPGISLALRVDPAGIIFGLSASALWILTSFFSIGYMRGLSEHKQTRYF